MHVCLCLCMHSHAGNVFLETTPLSDSVLWEATFILQEVRMCVSKILNYFLAYFPYCERTKVCLCDHLAVCVHMSVRVFPPYHGIPELILMSGVHLIQAGVTQIPTGFKVLNCMVKHS
jgi:hypothetical protein